MKHNEFIGKKHKRSCATLNNIEHLLILCSTITGYVSMSVFTSLAGTASSAVGIKICAITAGIKKCKSIIKKKRKSIIK